MNAGHFIHNKLDFDERNIHPQCIRCNFHLSGNLGIYAKYLIMDHGVEWLEELERDSVTKGNNYTRQEVEALTLKYKQKLNEI